MVMMISGVCSFVDDDDPQPRPRQTKQTGDPLRQRLQLQRMYVPALPAHKHTHQNTAPASINQSDLNIT